MKKILINSKSSEETRIATLNNGKLIDLNIENINREQKKANIYKGYISRIEPSLNAIFVNYGEEKNGFLPFKEVSEYYLKDTPNGENIAHLLSEGQELIVQIDKEERGDKGAALTTFITLAGSYMVLLPNSADGGGISRRVEGEDRERLKKYLKNLNVPKNMGIIARTACVECSFEELEYDFNNLKDLWSSITETSHKIKKTALLHKESDIIIRTVRDHLKDDVKEIIVDSKQTFDDIKRQLKLFRQSFDTNKVKFYNQDLPLFTQFSIDQQIENAYKREIRLPSGGSIVIDTTEALVAIDVNSSRANNAADVETTAFKTNLEAAEEVARQLRIRDLGGLVIIDFIDMSFYPNRKQVEEKLMEALKHDKARIQMSRISKLGLVEISRQRLSSSINESVMQKCPRCDGHGFIKTTPATALTILRKIRTEAMREDTNEIRVQVPVDIAAYILNEKRESIVNIEETTNVRVMIIPNFNMESPKFQMQRIWGSSYKSNRTSPELIEDVYNVEIPKSAKKKKPVDLTTSVANKKVSTNTSSNTNAKKNEKSNKPKAKPVQVEEEKSIISKIIGFIFGSNANDTEKETPKKENNNKKPKQAKKSQQQSSQNKNSKNTRDSNANNSNANGNGQNKNQYNKNNSNSQKSQNRQRNDNRDSNKSNDFNKNKRNDKFDKRSNSKNSNNQRNSNVNLNNAEEVIDITKAKYKTKAATKTNNVKKIISKNPSEFISVMVKDVLDNYDSLKDDGAQKITTDANSKTQKYLTFDTVSVDSELNAQANANAKQKPSATAKKAPQKVSNNPVKETDIKVKETKQVEDKPKATKTEQPAKEEAKKQSTASSKDKKVVARKKTSEKAKNQYIEYSAALDFESQNMF